MALYDKGLLGNGDYFVVGVDIEQYDPSKPDKYLRGLLLEKNDARAVVAFQSYLGIYPTAPIKFAEFAKEVSKCEILSRVIHQTKTKQIRYNFNGLLNENAVGEMETGKFCLGMTFFWFLNKH